MPSIPIADLFPREGSFEVHTRHSEDSTADFVLGSLVAMAQRCPSGAPHFRCPRVASQASMRSDWRWGFAMQWTCRQRASEEGDCGGRFEERLLHVGRLGQIRACLPQRREGGSRGPLPITHGNVRRIDQLAVDGHLRGRHGSRRRDKRNTRGLRLEPKTATVARASSMCGLRGHAVRHHSNGTTGMVTIDFRISRRISWRSWSNDPGLWWAL